LSKTYHIQTYGCQMNVSDSELVESVLIKEGYNAIDNPDIADVLFVNTCSIREHAEDKVHSLLGRYNLLKKNKPSMIIGVLGCLALMFSITFAVGSNTQSIKWSSSQSPAQLSNN